jgi:hypothetical protein
VNGPTAARSDRFVAWLIRWRWWVLIAATLVGVVGGMRTLRTYAALRSDIEELLPRSAPSVKSLAMLRQRLPSLRYLGVVIDTGDSKNVDAAHRFVDDLAARVQAYPSELVGLVKKDLHVEREFLETHALKLVDPSDLRELRRAVERRRDWEVSRELGTNLLADDEDPRPEIPLDKLRHKYQARFGRGRIAHDDRFVSPDGRTVVLVIQAASHATSYEADHRLLSRVQQDIARLGFPDAYAPGMRVGFAADVATRVEEMEGGPSARQPAVVLRDVAGAARAHDPALAGNPDHVRIGGSAAAGDPSPQLEYRFPRFGHRGQWHQHRYHAAGALCRTANRWRRT